VNWLAHLYLSEPDPEFRLGNLLADVVKRGDRARMGESFLRGTRRHHAIDAFTDSHPIVCRSKARMGDGYPHVKGILVDLFYDHFLAAGWERHAGGRLDSFTAEVYSLMRACTLPLPGEARDMLQWILRADRLGAYRSVAGIESALRRLSDRLSARVGKELALHRAVADLLQHYDGLRSDFDEFFPLLRAHVSPRDVRHAQTG